MSSRLARPTLAAAGRQTPRCTRSYAAAAAVDPKPPIPLFGVDGTYASALVCLIMFVKTFYGVYYRSYTHKYPAKPTAPPLPALSTKEQYKQY